MSQAKSGDVVKVHYRGRFADGTEFDSSIEEGPLQFTIGQGQIIPGFEEAVIGLNTGESTTTIIPADKAYGPYRKEMILEVPRDQFPEDIRLNVGEELELSQPDDKIVVVTIAGVTESMVTLDANHPLAGKDLTFDIHLVEIL
ncbi:MAG: peptidylprolyl isomerase [Nitrospirae bacterium]|nr:peptidylprolyl isomerase [Nitrospirota bacterium]